MGRKKKRRFVQGIPQAVFFKPQGIPMKELQRQAISVEGFEALRLVDGEGQMQQEAADSMGVSRPTLSRILAEARKGVAIALTNGWAIEIEGGHYHCHEEPCCQREQATQGEETMPNMDGTGPMGGQGGGRGRGGGAGGGQGRGMGRGNKGGCPTGRGQGGQGRGQGPCGQARGNKASRQNGQGAGQGNQQRTRTIQNNTPQTTLETNVKKIAVTSQGPTLDDNVDSRFGRAAGFVVIDLETMETEYIDNGSSQTMSQGAGIQAAENVANAGVDAVLTGYVGPKAFSALSAAGVQVGQDVDGMTVKEAMEKFKAGTVTMAASPNAAGGAHK